MALPSLYDEITFHNNTTPALNEDNLNAMSHALKQVDDRVIGLAGTIMEDVPQIQEALEILEPAIENIDSNVERTLTAANDAEDSAETAEYWANVSNPPMPVTKDFANVITVDDAIPKAATDVKVKIEAVQDLHGYTKPWVGGAGKNKLPLTVAGIKAVNGGTWSGNSIAKNGVTFTILTDSDGNVTAIKANGTPSAETQFTIPFTGIPTGNYIANGCAGTTRGNYDCYFWNATIGARVKKWDGTTNSDSLRSSSNNAEVQVPNTTDTLYYNIRIQSGYAASNLMFYPMLRLSTISDSTFEPYSNICPITGHRTAKVTRTGKNLCYNSLGGYVVITNGVGKYETKASLTSLVFDCKANTSYTISGVTGKNRCVWGVFDTVPSNNDTTNYCANAGDTPNTITPTKSGVCVVYVANSVVDTSNAQIEKGNQATPYEPYNGTDYIIDLGSTRYGATLDVTSGVMTVNNKIVDLGDLTYDFNTPNNQFYSEQISGVVDSNDFVTSGIINSCYEIDTRNYSNYNAIHCRGLNGRRVYIVDTRFTDPVDLKTALTGQKILLPLATPFTVNLLSKEVQMLQGYNVLSANSGDVYLEYDASMIQRIANEKLDISTFKSVVASSSDFADFKTKVAAL